MFRLDGIGGHGINMVIDQNVNSCIQIQFRSSFDKVVSTKYFSRIRADFH